MKNVDDTVRVIACSILSLQAVFLIARLRSCARRSEPLCLAGFLCALAALLVAPGALFVHDMLLAVALWTGGAFLLRAARRTGALAWAGTSAGFALTLLLAFLLGYRGTAPYAAFRIFGVALLAAAALRLLVLLWRGSRSALLALTGVSCCMWPIAAAAELACTALGLPPPDLQLWPLCLLASCTAVLVFQEGYPVRDAWMGRLRGLAGVEQVMRGVYARLAATESALARQERLVACGILALGAAHEFKNTLSLIKTTAQFGLEAHDPAKKDRSMRLLVEHADVGQGSAISLLERISAEGREDARSLDASRDLADFLRMLRAAFRGEGIVLQTRIADDVRLRARASELEQMILNLVRNSADAYRRKGEGRKPITVAAWRERGGAVFEVQDEAGGLDNAASEKLFQPAGSDRGGTGLGLYLTRSLAAQNGGSVEYLPTEGGSIFRLMFPGEEEDESAL